MRLKYSIQTNRLSFLTINVEMLNSMRRGIVGAKIQHFIHKNGLFRGNSRSGVQASSSCLKRSRTRSAATSVQQT